MVWFRAVTTADGTHYDLGSEDCIKHEFICIMIYIVLATIRLFHELIIMLDVFEKPTSSGRGSLAKLGCGEQQWSSVVDEQDKKQYLILSPPLIVPTAEVAGTTVHR